MTLSDFVYKHLKDIATTAPAPAPMETDLPFITYTFDGEEQTKNIGGGGVAQHFVSIECFEAEYDKAQALAKQIKGALTCVQGEENIIGVTYASSTNGYESEPVKRYFVTLEFNIFERS